MTAIATTGVEVRTAPWEDREDAVRQYLPLVRYVVRRLGYEGGFQGMLDSEDLLSFGVIGLIEAIDRFDPGKGVRFEAYAGLRIKGAILDAIRAVDPLPRGVRQKSRAIERARSSLAVSLEREPSVIEVCEATELSAAKYHQTVDLTAVRATPLGVSSNVDSSGDSIFSVQIADPHTEAEFESIERAELAEALAMAVKLLPERELLIVSLHYEQSLSLGDVARVLNISPSRVSQLHARALQRLRITLAARDAA